MQKNLPNIFNKHYSTKYISQALIVVKCDGIRQNFYHNAIFKVLVKINSIK
jgi:hypothetical protein